MIFKSQQINLDPKPYFDTETDDLRLSRPVSDPTGSVVFRPRPVGPQGQIFEPTRDPEPWYNRGYSEEFGAVHRYGTEVYARKDAKRYKLDAADIIYSPRREQFDTPINPILVAFREDGSTAHNWLANLEGRISHSPPDQIDHAKKVLLRLATFTKESN